MSDDTPLFVAIMSIVALLGFALGLLLGVTGRENHTNIVKHTDAYYHPQTGEFTWPDKKETGE